MPLNIEEEALARKTFTSFRDEPITHPANDSRYAPIYEKMEQQDPVRLMLREILYRDIESVQLFSGYRGSGKTTELFRLREMLAHEPNRKHVIYYANAMEYINPGEPLTAAQFLLILAGAFGEAIQTQDGPDIINETYWEGFVNFLKSEVVIEPTGKMSVENPLAFLTGPGIKSKIDIKVTLKDSESFKQRLTKALENVLGDVHAHAKRFFQNCVRAIRARHGEHIGIVFLFDNLEQMRGSLGNEQVVFKSVELLFKNHFDLLKIPFVHCVYTVPPWLKIILPNLGGGIRMIPSIKLWNNDYERSPAEGREQLLSFIRKRFEKEEFTEFFGAGEEGVRRARNICDQSGGHFRDLLRMVRECVLRAGRLPITDEVATNAIAALRREFLPIALDDAKWLENIGRERNAMLAAVEAEPVNRLMRFLDTHYVLYFVNGEEWYDIHPLIRTEVAKIVKLIKTNG